MPELENLAKVIIQLKKDKIKNVKKAVGESLGRSEQTIQKIRTKTECKQSERRVKEEIMIKKAKEKEAIALTKSDEVNTDKAGIVEDIYQPEIVGKKQVREVQNTDAQGSYSKTLENTPQFMTPKRMVRRQLLILPPTPIIEDVTPSRMLLDQDNLQICNTLSEK